MSNVVEFPSTKISDLAVTLSLLPLRLTPFPIVLISDGVMDEAANYCLKENIKLTGKYDGNLAPALYDVNFRHAMDEWILDQTYFEYVNLLIKHGLLVKQEE